jgi:hypothetical protein
MQCVHRDQEHCSYLVSRGAAAAKLRTAGVCVCGGGGALIGDSNSICIRGKAATLSAVVPLRQTLSGGGGAETAGSFPLNSFKQSISPAAH